MGAGITTAAMVLLYGILAAHAARLALLRAVSAHVNGLSYEDDDPETGRPHSTSGGTELKRLQLCARAAPRLPPALRQHSSWTMAADGDGAPAGTAAVVAGGQAAAVAPAQMRSSVRHARRVSWDACVTDSDAQATRHARTQSL